MDVHVGRWKYMQVDGYNGYTCGMSDTHVIDGYNGYTCGWVNAHLGRWIHM